MLGMCSITRSDPEPHIKFLKWMDRKMEGREVCVKNNGWKDK